MNQTVWKRKDCVSAEVEGALVLLDLETLHYHSLNPTATTVWQLLEQPATQPALVEALCERYDVTREHCAASVSRLIESLRASDLVIATASPA